jgi:hypothetical protein
LAAASLYISSELMQVDLMACKVSGPGDMDSRVSTRFTNREGEDSVADFDGTLGKRAGPGCSDGLDFGIYGAKSAMKKVSGRNLVNSAIFDVKSFFDHDLENTDTKNRDFNTIVGETKNLEIEPTPEVDSDIYDLEKLEKTAISDFSQTAPKIEAVPTNSETNSTWLYNGSEHNFCGANSENLSNAGCLVNRNPKAFDVNNCFDSASQSPVLDGETILHQVFSKNGNDQDSSSLTQSDCQFDSSSSAGQEPKLSASPDCTSLGDIKLCTSSDFINKKAPLLWYKI